MSLSCFSLTAPADAACVAVAGRFTAVTALARLAVDPALAAAASAGSSALAAVEDAATAGHDVRVLALALLANLTEHVAANRPLVAAAPLAVPLGSGLGLTDLSASAPRLVSALVTAYATLVAAATTAAQPEDETSCNVAAAYVALLLGCLVHDCASVADEARAALELERVTHADLARHIQEFIIFQRAAVRGNVFEPVLGSKY